MQQTDTKMSRNLSEAAEVAQARRWFAWFIALAMVCCAIAETTSIL